MILARVELILRWKKGVAAFEMQAILNQALVPKNERLQSSRDAAARKRSYAAGTET